jgi:hypothetical protein
VVVTVSDGYVDVFLAVDSRGRETTFASSIFPSDARSTCILDFSLYSGTSSFRDSVTPVRGREDTERNGDAGVKVQIAWSLGRPTRMPLEVL